LQSFNHRFFGFYKTWFLIAIDCSVLFREALACAPKLRKSHQKLGFLKIKSDSIFAWISLFSLLSLLTSSFPRNHLPQKKIVMYIFTSSLYLLLFSYFSVHLWAPWKVLQDTSPQPVNYSKNIILEFLLELSTTPLCLSTHPSNILMV
jgi:hypothetical protein